MYHKNINNYWKKMTLPEQMGNIGSEFNRFIKWQAKEEQEQENKSLDRLLELLDLSIENIKINERQKELLRLREVIGDIFYQGKIYNTNEKWIKKYFLNFGLLIKK